MRRIAKIALFVVLLLVSAVRYAVISRRISFGTRTTEGSQAYACLLSVIETCRLRDQDPWLYSSEAIALGRKGIAPPSIKA